MGEVGGIRPPGFDFGNSPYELSQADVRGKVLAQSTRAGTVGVCAVPGVRPIYAASLVVARATASRILQRRPDVVTLVAMGRTGRVRADEDEVCAMYLRNLLEGRDTPHDAIRALIRSSAESVQYDDPTLPQFHPGDREIALDVDRYDFAIAVAREGSLVVASMDPPTAAAP
jgi:2-phosphosulfolactate phosphatase